MSLLGTNKIEKNRILKLHMQESTSTKSSGSYETPMAWQSGGELTQPPREEIMSVELGVTLPSEVDITGGNIGGFGDIGPSPCSSCGNSHDGPCDYSEMSDEIDDEVWDIDIEDDLSYNPKKVVHKDDEHIVIDKDLDWEEEIGYDDDDVSYEDGDWMVIDVDSQEEISDVLPDSLLNLFGDVNIGGDLEIEIEEEPKKLRGSRKFRK